MSICKENKKETQDFDKVRIIFGRYIEKSLNYETRTRVTAG